MKIRDIKSEMEWKMKDEEEKKIEGMVIKEKKKIKEVKKELKFKGKRLKVMKKEKKRMKRMRIVKIDEEGKKEKI